MRITRKVAHQMIAVLDDLREEMKGKSKAPYPYAEWEQKREKVRERLRKLPAYVEQAVSMLTIKRAVGGPKKGDLVQRTMLFLFARLMNKSNRDVEELLELFSPLFGVTMSYKSVERLYSDEEVKLVLHNLFILLLRDEPSSGDLAGDGTGYSLTLTRQYRSNPKKRSKDYRYAFRLIDIQTGLYVGAGYSPTSEMEAFHEAMDMAEDLGIRIKRIRLDKYYSSSKVLKFLPKDAEVYVLPKKNIAKISLQWSKVIRRIKDSPAGFLKEYFQRNLSEGGYSSDKRRFGGFVRQRRADRQEMALFSLALLHNVFFVRVNPG